MTPYAFIWDLDGTLLDSYDVIVSSLYDTLREHGVTVSREEIHRCAIQTSVGDFLTRAQAEYGFDMDSVKTRNSDLAHSRVLEIRPMPGAGQTLRALMDLGCRNYVYTHKGNTTSVILDHLQLTDCFEEIITSAGGFPRKPQPHGLLYLVEKYGLDPTRTFYVGDRRIDVECAANAGIGSILYLPSENVTEPTGLETCIVQSLDQIPALVKE